MLRKIGFVETPRAALQREELFDEMRHGKNGRAHIEGVTVLLPDVRAPTRGVEFLDDRRPNAETLQPDAEGESADTGPDNDGVTAAVFYYCHRAVRHASSGAVPQASPSLVKQSGQRGPGREETPQVADAASVAAAASARNVAGVESHRRIVTMVWSTSIVPPSPASVCELSREHEAFRAGASSALDRVDVVRRRAGGATLRLASDRGAGIVRGGRKLTRV
ncbi:MAG: hypothetical protein NVS3B16_05170 [Vulcanimicrobiaceae bacterium]